MCKEVKRNETELIRGVFSTLIGDEREERSYSYSICSHRRFYGKERKKDGMKAIKKREEKTEKEY